MLFSTDIWKLLAGVAIFLLGMRFLEDSLQQLAGRSFKLFLKKQTASKPKAVLGGALVTGILQSSSVVNLMVLAFVGAHVMPMQNALAVVLGANLGTTLSNWIIATVGFNFNIEYIAYPLAGVFGIGMTLVKKESLLYKWSKFLFGFGFLFIGLNYMKTGMEDTVKQVDLAAFNHYPVIFFLLLGFIITSLIQSSTATMAILLSALHANAIGLFAATAVALGSEAGTSIKLLLASVKGLPDKKRVAYGNLIFNIVTSLIVFIFLLPVNRFITGVLGIGDDLLALVFFQSLVNVLAIILFYPFLKPFGRFLEKRFTAADDESHFIHKVNVRDTELAMLALENEVKHFMLHTIGFTRAVFERPDEELLKTLPGKDRGQNDMEHYYETLKQLHGETHGYAMKLQDNTTADAALTQRLEQLIASNRNTMYAAKNIKDALPDISQLRNSSNNTKYGFYRDVAGRSDDFCKKITHLLLHEKPASCFGALNELFRSVTKSYSLILQQLYRENLDAGLSEIELSTLINFNREMYTAYKSFVFALKDYLLDEKQAAYFDELPGFIR